MVALQWKSYRSQMPPRQCWDLSPTSTVAASAICWPWPARRSASQTVNIRRTRVLLCRTFSLIRSSWLLKNDKLSVSTFRRQLKHLLLTLLAHRARSRLFYSNALYKLLTYLLTCISKTIVNLPRVSSNRELSRLRCVSRKYFRRKRWTALTDVDELRHSTSTRSQLSACRRRSTESSRFQRRRDYSKWAKRIWSEKSPC